MITKNLIVKSENFVVNSESRPVKSNPASQPAYTCSKLKIETLEKSVKYIQS